MCTVLYLIMDRLEKDKLIMERSAKRGCPSAPIRKSRQLPAKNQNGHRVMSAVSYSPHSGIYSAQPESDKIGYRLSLKEVDYHNYSEKRKITMPKNHLVELEQTHEEDNNNMRTISEGDYKGRNTVSFSEELYDRNTLNKQFQRRAAKSKSATSGYRRNLIKPRNDNNIFGNDENNDDYLAGKRKGNYPNINRYSTESQNYGMQRATSVPHWFYGSKADGRIRHTINQRGSNHGTSRNDNSKKNSKNKPKIVSNNNWIEGEEIGTEDVENENDVLSVADDDSPVKMTPMLPLINQTADEKEPLDPRQQRENEDDDAESDDFKLDKIKHNSETSVPENSDRIKDMQVLRTLPLESDLDKYLFYLHATKKRSSLFTNSFNRYVPGVPPRKGGPISRPYQSQQQAPVMDKQRSRFGEETLTAAKLATLGSGSYQDIENQRARVNSSHRKLKVQLSDNIIRRGSGSRSHVSATSSNTNTVSA